MHVHVFSNETHPDTDLSSWAFPLFIANGVTGVRDMWTDPDDIEVAIRWNRERARGRRSAPRVEWTSEIVDGVPPSHRGGVAVGSADEARRAVRQLEATGSRFIKIYWNLSPEAFYAIADETKRQGIAFGGHVPWTVSAFDASAAGMKSIEHLTGIQESCSPRAAEFQTLRDLTPELEEARWTSFDARRCRALYATFVEHHTWQVPTLIFFAIQHQREELGRPTSPALAYARPEDLADWAKSRIDEQPPAVGRAHFDLLRSIVRDMNSAGVGILAGTDVGNEYVMPGFSLHDELEILVDAGLTPLHNTRAIAGVVLDGRYLDRAALDRLLPPPRRP